MMMNAFYPGWFRTSIFNYIEAPLRSKSNLLLVVDLNPDYSI